MKYKTVIKLGRRIYKCEELLDYRRRYVFYIRCILNRKIITEQLKFFSASIFRLKMLTRTPYFLDQVVRQVFCKNSSPAERAQKVRQHIELMEKLVSKELLKKIYVDGHRVLLWKDEYKERPLALFLVYRDGQQKEGCLSLELVYDSLELENTDWDYGYHVYQIIFTMGKNKRGRKEIRIGALQGLAHGGELIKGLTKAYFGWRPKNLIFWCLQSFAELLGVEEIYAVTNKGHYAQNHYRRDRKLKVDLDSFWQECKGQAQEDKRFYRLPVSEERRKTEELKPSKRAQHRRRYKKMEEIRTQLEANLTPYMKKNVGLTSKGDEKNAV